MQLQLYPYRRWILAECVHSANSAVILSASLGICCHNQSSYEDQAAHLESATVKLT
jgi:hypothetical protein